MLADKQKEEADTEKKFAMLMDEVKQEIVFSL
jgi:hypothetical protein